MRPREPTAAEIVMFFLFFNQKIKKIIIRSKTF